jgi:hypothetical protein
MFGPLAAGREFDFGNRQASAVKALHSRFVAPADPRPGRSGRLATTSGGTISFATPTTFTISAAGDTAWMTFTGSTGMHVSMTTSMSGTWTAKILDASTGQLVASCSTNCNGGSNFIDATSLPSTPGETLYKVQLTASVAGNATITLYSVPDDLAFSTTPVSGSGASVPISITTPGQNAVITFQGRQGERLAWAHSDATTVYSTKLLNANTNPPTLLVSCGYSCNGGSAFLEPFTLPADATYKVVFDPGYTWTGSKTITLYDVPDDLTFSTTPVSGSGASVPISISTPGQNAVITFQGRQGERLSWGHSDALSVYSTTLRDANTPNTVLVSCGYSCNGGSAFLEPFTLTADGTYRVVFDPGYGWKGSKTVVLYDVPNDLAVSLTPTPAATSVSFADRHTGAECPNQLSGVRRPNDLLDSEQHSQGLLNEAVRQKRRDHRFVRLCLQLVHGHAQSPTPTFRRHLPHRLRPIVWLHRDAHDHAQIYTWCVCGGFWLGERRRDLACSRLRGLDACSQFASRLSVANVATLLVPLAPTLLARRPPPIFSGVLTTDSATASESQPQTQTGPPRRHLRRQCPSFRLY